jgi:UrcA family protein
MSIRYIVPALATLTSIAAIATSHPAIARSAGSDFDAMSLRVSYADLNLDSAAGAETMLRRVHNAALSICGDEPSAPLERVMVYRSCVRATVNRAVATLGNPRVAEMNGGVRRIVRVEVAAARP